MDTENDPFLDEPQDNAADESDRRQEAAGGSLPSIAQEWHWTSKDAFGKDYQAREASNRQLARAMRDGDPMARERLIIQNIGLVLYWVKPYVKRTTPGMSEGDLCSEGTIGLIKAIERFNPDGDKPFFAIASCWIKQAIRRALVKRANLIHLPERIENDLGHLRYAEDQLTAAFHARPSDQDIADFLNASPAFAKRPPVTIERVRELKRLAERPVSIDKPIGDSGDGGTPLTLGDTLPADLMLPHEEAERKYMIEQMMLHLAQLPEREQFILKAWAGFNEPAGHDQQRTTLDDIAKKLSISRQRVQEVRNRALKKLADLLWQER